MTCAPRWRASWVANWPTLPAAPWISTRSPAFRPPCSNNPCQAQSPRERDRRTLDRAGGLRLRRQERGRNDRVVGGDAVAVEFGERVDAIADGDPGDVVGEGGDHPAELVGRDRGQPVERPLELAAGDRRRLDPHQRLARPGHRGGDPLVDEPLGAARRLEANRAHGLRDHVSRRSGW